MPILGDDEPKIIDRKDIRTYITEHGVIDKRTNCPCGWYEIYSAKCGHKFAKLRHMCCNTRSPNGRIRLCKKSARRNILDVRVDELCSQCASDQRKKDVCITPRRTQRKISTGRRRTDRYTRTISRLFTYHTSRYLRARSWSNL